MKVISTVKKLCLSCMEEHEVKRVEVQEENIFKGIKVDYPAKYEYCDRTEEYLTYEDSLNTNDLAFKDAYRKKVGLLTSQEIVEIRTMYDVSQKDFCKILGWGSSTIARYENHQVQDGIHDDVLRKVANDPKWFMELLNRVKGDLPEKAYLKYLNKGKEYHHQNQNKYLKESIEAAYVKYDADSDVRGNADLDIDKAVEVINYLAQNVPHLHKVKLMKMLWYCDYLHYKREERAITGLVYSALPRGAVPEGYETLVLLDGVEYDEVQYDEHVGYKFKASKDFKVKRLCDTEIQVIDEVIELFKNYNTKQIVDKMHEEEAYKNTPEYQQISYKYAKNLSI
ncbi:MAG: type II TA system antitoxin MqsA family protein [Syntrophothermaceae bacterium]|jgi:putative zinc finger/helix-turn-helix YgiT family protein